MSDQMLTLFCSQRFPSSVLQRTADRRGGLGGSAGADPDGFRRPVFLASFAMLFAERFAADRLLAI